MHETSNFRGHLLTVVVTSVAAVAFVLMLLSISGGLAAPGSAYKVRAVVPQAGSLTKGTRVTMAGVQVGTVSGLERRGNGAVVDLRLTEEDVTPLPEDTKAFLRVRTALGENYVELEPGSSRDELESGALLAVNRDDQYADVDEVLSLLRGDTRERARLMLQGLGRAVDGRGGELHQTLRTTAGILESGSSLTQTLLPRREQIRRLVTQLGQVTAGVGARGDAIEQVGRQGLVSFRALASRDEALSKLLGELPGTLAQVRKSTGKLAATSSAATPVVADLAAAVREVRPAVRRLAPAVREGRGVVRELDGAISPLRGTVGELRKLANPAARTLPQLRKVLCEVNPMLRYAKPYTQDLIGAVTGLNAASNSYDAVGHTIRLMPIFNDNTLVGLPDEVSEAAFKLLHTGLLAESNGLNHNPYPKPGMANTDRPAGVSNIGPRDQKAAGYTFPRIQADC